MLSLGGVRDPSHFSVLSLTNPRLCGRLTEDTKLDLHGQGASYAIMAGSAPAIIRSYTPEAHQFGPFPDSPG